MTRRLSATSISVREAADRSSLPSSRSRASRSRRAAWWVHAARRGRARDRSRPARALLRRVPQPGRAHGRSSSIDPEEPRRRSARTPSTGRRSCASCARSRCRPRIRGPTKRLRGRRGVSRGRARRSRGRAARKPGDVPLFRRLTRTEYRNAIRDLLAVEHMPSELDFELLLPADNASSGFDNIADLLFVSPVVMERYIAAAQKIARLAVGDMRAPVMVNIHKLVRAAAAGRTRRRAVVRHARRTRRRRAISRSMPSTSVDVETASAAREPHEIELSVDGARVAVAGVGGAQRARRSARGRARDASACRSRPARTWSASRSSSIPKRSTRASCAAACAAAARCPRSRWRRFAGRTRRPAPATRRAGSGSSSAGRAAPAEKLPCAREILSTLARRAYRRPADRRPTSRICCRSTRQGRAEGDFDAGSSARARARCS